VVAELHGVAGRVVRATRHREHRVVLVQLEELALIGLGSPGADGLVGDGSDDATPAHHVVEALIGQVLQREVGPGRCEPVAQDRHRTFLHRTQPLEVDQLGLRIEPEHL